MTWPSLPYPQPDPRIMTEFALASDGYLYLSMRDWPPKDILHRPVFEGYALRGREVARLGRKNLLMWAMIEILALGSDGRVYVNANAMQHADGRPIFRGYRASSAEVVKIVEHFHASAMNLTIGLHELSYAHECEEQRDPARSSSRAHGCGRVFPRASPVGAADPRYSSHGGRGSRFA